MEKTTKVCRTCGEVRDITNFREYTGKKGQKACRPKLKAPPRTLKIPK